MSIKPQRGVTLIEMIFFIVIVSVALAGLIQVFAMVTRDSADPVRRKQALMLAESMMAEVQLAGITFCDPADENAATAAGPGDCTIPEAFGQEGAAGARPYDNVNDYVTAPNTPTEAFGTVNHLTDVNGNTIDAAGFSADVTVSPVALGGIGDTTPTSAVLQITVVVRYDEGQAIRLDGYRVRYAPQFQ
jgi:MSHA pilin protein MshD